jgi:hypothetical protein
MRAMLKTALAIMLVACSPGSNDGVGAGAAAGFSGQPEQGGASGGGGSPAGPDAGPSPTGAGGGISGMDGGPSNGTDVDAGPPQNGEAYVTQSGTEITIGNQFLSRTFSIANQKLQTLRIENKRNHTTAAASPSDEFRLRLSQGTHIDGTDVTLTGPMFALTSWTSKDGPRGSKVLDFALTNANAGIDVVLSAELFPDQFYMKKYLQISRRSAITLELAEVDVVKLAGGYQPYTQNSMATHGTGLDSWKPPLGQPVYVDTSGLFFGVELAASVNRANAGEISAGYLWGRELPSQTYRTHASVCGAAENAHFIRKSFLEYVDSIRIRPLGLQTQYNSWFDYGASLDKAKFATSVHTISSKLFQSRQVTPFKIFAIDDSWQNTSSFWLTNSKFDPDFASSRQEAEAVGSHLGLWLSPMGGFGSRLTQLVSYLEGAGYETVDTYMCMAGTRYMADLEKRLVELVHQGIRYFKLDGIFGQLYDRDFCPFGQQHGHPYHPAFTLDRAKPDDPKWDEMKMYYLTAGVERLDRILEAMHQANPDIYVLLSNGAWLSPWWLTHADAIWMINAGDGSPGTTRTPQIVYRDERYHMLYVEDRVQFPLASMFNHEPQKQTVDADLGDFTRYLYMHASRGSAFFEWYMKPSIITEPEWDAIAANIKWVESHFDVLRHMEFHGGDPGSNAVYGYTGWTFSKGVVSMHNPSTAAQSYSFTLDRSMGVEEGSGPFTVSSPIDAMSIPGTHAYGDKIDVTIPAQGIFVWEFSGPAAP